MTHKRERDAFTIVEVIDSHHVRIQCRRCGYAKMKRYRIAVDVVKYKAEVEYLNHTGGVFDHCPSCEKHMGGSK